jgi:hypothetical protein
VTTAIRIDPSALVSDQMLKNRVELAYADALLDQAARTNEALARIDETLARIEARLSESAPTAGDDRPAAAAAREQLARAGIEGTVGPGAWPELLGRSRRETDRMRSSGAIVAPDFYAGRSPRWRAETVRRWMESQGGQK